MAPHGKVLSREVKRAIKK